MVVNKQSFYENIKQNTVFDLDFFKKVYGYSICDDLFLAAVAAKLIGLGRQDVIQTYNAWYTAWRTEDDLEMKKVAEWYHKECNREFKIWQKEQRGKAVKEWKEKRVEDLLQKNDRELLNLLQMVN